MLLLQNGYLLDPKSGFEGKRDVLMEEGRIVKIASFIEPKEDTECLNVEGLFVAPGLVDVHVHFRDPGFTYKEDIFSGAEAAAAGGITTVVLMANTKPVVDNEGTLSYVLEKGRQTKIHVETCCSVTKGLGGKELAPLELLARNGAVGFTDDGIPILEEALLQQAMEVAAKLRLPISLHEENPALIENNGINSEAAKEIFGLGGSPREAEISMIERDVEIALRTGADVDIQHISTKEGVELVRKAKAKGAKIHAEATPHHFTLTQEAVKEYKTLAKMNPPLRTEEDRLAIIEGLADGTIDLIATDHAPHSKEEKEREFTKAPSGIIGLETALSLALTSLVEEAGLPLMEVLRKMTYNPASLYHLDAGYLQEGGPADLVVFDRKETTIGESFASKSSNTPFVGRRVAGSVRYTICRGNIIYTSEKK